MSPDLDQELLEVVRSQSKTKSFASTFVTTYNTCVDVTATKLKGPAHFIELVIGSWGSTDDHEPTNGDGRQACDEEDAPEGSKDWETERGVMKDLNMI